MKKAFFFFAFILSLSGLYASSIPVIDLTRQDYSTSPRASFPSPSSYYPSAQNPGGATYSNGSEEQSASASAPISQHVPPVSQPQSRTLRLFLRELSVLQQAARAAGGDIKVSITPVGITAEDMIAPLSQMGWFDIRPEGNLVIVQSKSEDPYLSQVRSEIAQLEKRRRVLIDNVQTLEQVSSEQSTAASYSSPQLQPVSYSAAPQVSFQQSPARSSQAPGYYSTAPSSLPAQSVGALYDHAAYSSQSSGSISPPSTSSTSYSRPQPVSPPVPYHSSSSPVIETSSAASMGSELDLQRSINPADSFSTPYSSGAVESQARDVPSTQLPSPPIQASTQSPSTQAW